MQLSLYWSQLLHLTLPQGPCTPSLVSTIVNNKDTPVSSFSPYLFDMARPKQETSKCGYHSLKPMHTQLRHQISRCCQGYHVTHVDM